MKIKLLLAINDKEYSGYLSKVLASSKEDTFEITTILNKEQMLNENTKYVYEIIIISEDMYCYFESIDKSKLIVLVDETRKVSSQFEKFNLIKKYQRISNIKKEVIEIYANKSEVVIKAKKGECTLSTFWSPIGGVGKTTLALAYCLQKSLQGKKVIYCNLENFSSVPSYFELAGKTISTVFEKIDSNLDIHIQSNLSLDENTGINYFEPANNYDDINILTPEQIEKFIKSCEKICDELVLDLSSTYNEKVKTMLEISTKIYLVTNSNEVCEKRMELFYLQHNVYDKIKNKIKYVYNKCNRNSTMYDKNSVVIPFINVDNYKVIYKTISINTL